MTAGGPPGAVRRARGPGQRPGSPRGRRWRPLLAAALLAAPGVAAAWPAVQDATGIVYLCESRPVQLPSGHWSCRSVGGARAGVLVEVVGPGGPPGARPWDPSGAPYRWGPPPREPSGYDALDPWLPPGGGTGR